MAAFVRQSYIGMKHMGLGKEKSSSRTMSSRERQNPRRLPNSFVVCIDNKGYPASLERNKIYPVLRDERAAQDGLIRVIDESGEDYLYSKKRFAAIRIPAPVRASVVPATLRTAHRRKSAA
jgi:hypothetical protein